MIKHTIAIQIEIAKELINTNDATIVGILLGVIAILITAIGILWKKHIKDEEYIRAQDKANLEMLSALTKNAELLGNDIAHVKDYTIEAKPVINNILETIKERLNKQH